MHQRAVLAGGCFWGMQDLIRKLPGVVFASCSATSSAAARAADADQLQPSSAAPGPARLIWQPH